MSKDDEVITVSPTPQEVKFWPGWPSWPMRIKYYGLFDWEGLYRLIFNWMQDKEYFYEEPSYQHKVPSPLGAEQKIRMSGWRKTTEQMREWIFLYIHFFEMREVEVIKDGKKQKLIKARVYIEITGRFELDYQERWKQTYLGAYLKDFYDKYLIKKHAELMFWDRLYYRIYKLNGEIKQFLDMQARENAYYDVW